MDFAIIKEGMVEELIEVKYSEANISSGLRYYVRRLKPAKAFQIVGTLENSYDEGDIRVLSPLEYFQNPPWASQHLV